MAIVNVWVNGETGRRVEPPRGDRWYMNEATEELAVGVSACVDMLPKPKLPGWASRMAATFVVDNIDSVAALAKNDRDAALDLIKGAPWRKSGRAADAGTEVHTYTETVARAVAAGTKPQAKITPGVMPFLKQYVRFLTECQVKPVLMEAVVWNPPSGKLEYGYAGRFDLLAQIYGRDEYVIIDTKTGASGIYESAALQQTAYRYAESYYDEATDTFKPMPKVSATYGLWLRPEGWALQPLLSEQDEWEQFQRLHASYLWKMRRGKKAVQPAINENPLKRQWRGNRS